MEMKAFNGKAIYQPAGKAQEYAQWACNFYVGCSNGCTYCYLKKGIGKDVLGGEKPTLKKCFKDEENALEVFEKELLQNIDELHKHGLFFSFTTDPMLPETIMLIRNSVWLCLKNHVPVKILTKNASVAIKYSIVYNAFDNMLMNFQGYDRKIAFGFTLTGHDELEPGASTNAERIEAMKKLHEIGFKTFASIEPIIDFESSFRMIYHTQHFCDLYKIGLASGQKVNREYYEMLRSFNLQVVNLFAGTNVKVYWKESIRKHFGVFPDAGCNVERDYNLFK
jgi:DNA repair photolyase